MENVSIRIDIAVEGADAEVLSDATRHLRDELLRLDVDSVKFAPLGQPPAGAKAGAELAALATLLVTAPESGAIAGAVAQVIRGWIARAHGRSARLEVDGDVLDVGGLSGPEQERLIEYWLERRRKRESAK